MSEGSDRATLQQLVVTGLGAADSQCSGCPAGSCGTAGAVEGCSVCPPSSKSKEIGSIKCDKCDPAPDSAHHVGPPEWPAVGNTDTCGWECSEGYCSRDGTPRCPASMSCPAGMCCATSDGCTIPSIDAVRNGLSPATLQMLTTCLKLIPVDVVSASVTLDVATRLLGSGGLWRSRGEALGENSKAIVEAMQVLSSSKGEAIDGLLGKIAVSVRDQTLDPVTHIPKVSDWYGVHGPIGNALRSVGEINLRYSPPEFYQRISVFLPWSIALAFDPPGDHPLSISSPPPPSFSLLSSRLLILCLATCCHGAEMFAKRVQEPSLVVMHALCSAHQRPSQIRREKSTEKEKEIEIEIEMEIGGGCWRR